MDPRSRPGKSSYGRQQTTLGRSSITTTTAGLVRQAATSGTRGDTGAITTAPCYKSVSCGLEVRSDEGCASRRPWLVESRPKHRKCGPQALRIDNHFPCNARLASAYPSDA